MNTKRREFLKMSALSLAGMACSQLSPGLMGCNSLRSSRSQHSFGLQLYTLRDVLPQNPAGILKQVASFGYKEIESYEGPKGIFWGMKPTEFKKLMDDLGMKLVSSHCDIYKDFERKAEEAAQIGMSYLICPYVGPQKTLDDYKRIAGVFNQRGETCRKNGLRFGYHNHDYSFQLLQGQYPQDVLMQQTDKNLVDYELDIYWVVTAGQNPIEWLDKYPDRFRLSHVKDRKKNVPLSEKNESVVLGQGSIDFATILRKAREKGMRYFIVEQEKYENTTPVDAVQANAVYMKNLSL